MDLDTAKENIQPLRQGRRPERLEAAFGEHSKETLEAERKQYEEAISKYEGLDPLSAWYEYICWIEQSFAKGGTESGLDEAVLNCIVAFENDLRYRQDRRMIKLYIKYIDTQDNPADCYRQLYENGYGTIVADLYIAWSYYYDAINNFEQAEAVFRKGIDAKAQPFDELAQAHQAFSVSIAQRVLYKDESSQQKFRDAMHEKRSALTSLRAHKKKFVGSLRTGIAVKHDNPGVVNQENIPSAINVKFDVHEDAGTAATAAALPLPQETSVIRSIIDSARKKENAHEPGPWTKGKLGKSGKLFSREAAKSHLDFNIMEDDNLPPIPCPEKLYEKGIQLPDGFVSQTKPHTAWNIPMVVSEPAVPRAVPCYEKFLLYPNQSTEICPDEYRGYKWFKDREMTTRLTEQYDSVWANTFQSGIRIPPGFVSRNVPQVERVEFERFIPGEDIQGFVFSLGKIYPETGGEFSLEELLAEKYKRGEIVLMQEEDFEVIDDMELTQIGFRRESIYPNSRQSMLPRKSIIVRKSMMPPPTVEEDDESSEESSESMAPPSLTNLTGAIRKSIMKRKLDDVDYKPDDQSSNPKKDFVSETPPRSVFSGGLFKPPAPVDKKQVVFSMDEDDVTCSTQQFNFFLKAQSVSTPVTKKKTCSIVQAAEKPSTPPNEEASPSHDIDLAAATTSPNPDIIPKQLSTIMETTETTQSTKSSVSHASTENDTDLNPKTPKGFHKSEALQTQQEILRFDQLTTTLRLPDEQTETCMNYELPKLHSISKFLDATAPATPKFSGLKNHSVVLPPPQFDATIKSPASESSTKTIEHEVTQIENKTLKAEAAMAMPEESILEVPPALNLKSPIRVEESMLEVPACQTLKHEELPKHHEESLLDIPATQVDVEAHKESTDESIGDIPATQSDGSLGEIPETQAEPSEVIPATQVKPAPVHNATPFMIYEDSFMEPPQPPTLLPVSKLPVNDDTAFLHASRKENFLAEPPVARTISDEFLDLLASPQKKSPTAKKSRAPTEGPRNDMSDLLKFSSNSFAAAGALETSMNRLSIKPPTGKISSPFALDADLNTQNFQAALGINKNSTLLSGQRDQPERCPKAIFNSLNLSIDFEEDELIKMGLDKSKEKVNEVTATKDELQRLGLPAKEAHAEFKVPPVPSLKPIAAKPPASFDIFEDSEEEDTSKSIYIPKDAPVEDEEWDVGCSFMADDYNQYEHTVIEDERDISLKVKAAIVESNGDPFNLPMREAMLDHCNFSLWLAENVKTCQLLGKIPALRKDATINVAGNHFKVLSFIAKGSFGSIYTGKSSKTGEVFAMKQEKPPSLWEYYICVELRDRLKDKRMLKAFMNIEYAIIANNASVLISEFSPYGSIISVCNKFKAATNRNIDEYVVMVLTTQLLSIIDHLHSCKIIHADIKPDNFLFMSRIDFGMKVPAIQLIDFGSAIDMDWYDPSVAFTKVVSTENFVCCEMLEKKPWTYQTDLFGVAGTAHTMLFGRYMEVEKKLSEWNITTHYPRYLKKFLWHNFFTTMLNVPSCNEMPNLQSLKDQFEEVIQENQKNVCEKIADFNKIF